MKRAAAAALLFLGAAVAVPAAEITGFPFTAQLEGTVIPFEPLRTVLPPEVLSRSAPGLTDLRLFDDQGAEVPYVVYPRRIPEETTREVSLKVLSFEERPGERELVLERPPGSGPFVGLEIRTAGKDFKNKVLVERSSDQKAWSRLATDVIFDFSRHVDLRKTVIEIPPDPSRYFRLLFFDGDEDRSSGSGDIILRYNGLDFSAQGAERSPLRIDGVLGIGKPPRQGEAILDSLEIQHPPVEVDVRGDTIVDLGRVNLPLSSAAVAVGRQYYYRPVELLVSPAGAEGSYVPAATGRIYSVPGMNRASTTLQCRGSWVGHARLRIVNGDNPPLEVSQVVLSWQRLDLYFVPEEERTFALYFGGGMKGAPRYEAGMLVTPGRAGSGGFLELRTGGVRENPSYRPAPPVGGREGLERRIFGAVIVCIAVVLGFWIYRLIRKVPAAAPKGRGE